MQALTNGQAHVDVVGVEVVPFSAGLTDHPQASFHVRSHLQKEDAGQHERGALVIVLLQLNVQPRTMATAFSCFFAAWQLLFPPLQAMHRGNKVQHVSQTQLRPTFSVL